MGKLLTMVHCSTMHIRGILRAYDLAVTQDSLSPQCCRGSCRWKVCFAARLPPTRAAKYPAPHIFPGLERMALSCAGSRSSIKTSIEAKGFTDPRDRVFAMLGLSIEYRSSNLEFTADYTKSVCDTYTTFARAFLRASESTKLLSFAGPYKEGSELPSLVPDWRYGSGWRDASQLHSSVDTASGQRT